MKNLKGRGVFALAAVMSMFAVHPGDALAQGVGLITYSGAGSDLNAVLQIQTSLSEDATATLLGGAQTSLTVQFAAGQSGAQGTLIKPNGTLHCVSPFVTSGSATVFCAPGHAFFELVVN